MTQAQTPQPRTQATARAAVLNALKEAYPGTIGPEMLHELAGRPYPSRIGELITDFGWDIESVYRDGDPRPSYRLVSLAQGKADPAGWGLRARAGASSGLIVKPYGTSSIKLPEEIETKLMMDVANLIRAAFEQAGMRLPGPEKAETEPEEEEDDLITCLLALQNHGGSR